jgi:hypothetical protein
MNRVRDALTVLTSDRAPSSGWRFGLAVGSHDGNERCPSGSAPCRSSMQLAG